MDTMSDRRNRAIKLLIHYLDLAAAGSMPTHRGDFAGEMEELVDCIADLAVEKTAAKERERVAEAQRGYRAEDRW